MKKYVVYSRLIDDEPKEKYAHGGVDAEVGLSARIAEWLGESAETADDEKAHEYEVLVGSVDRDRSRECLEKLALNQYGVFCFEDGIAVAGHCVAAVLMAGELLLSTPKEMLVAGYERIETNSEWWIDYPRFTRGRYLGMTDCSYGRVQTVFGDTTDADLEYYTEQLECAGFSRVWQNQIEENRFVRYEKDGNFVHVTYRGRMRRTSIISGDSGRCRTVLPEKTECEGDCSVTLTQLALDYSGGAFGMCYVIRLADSSFIIIDGGQIRVKNGYPKTYDHVRLYTLLTELNKRADGEIVINGWFMTHEHSDHFALFYWFCKEYGSKIRVDKYYDCSCTDAVAYNAKNPEYHTTRGRLNVAQEWCGGFERVTLISGDVIEMGDVKLEILYTVDDLFPERLHYFNDASFVCTMTYGGQRTLWLGDICTAPSRFLRENYSEKTLKSHIVQLAHHGLNGAEKELYDIADGRVLLWSLRYRIVDDIFAKEPIEEHKKLAYYLRDEMRVEEIITHTKDNDTLTLPYYTQGGTRERL